MSAELELVEDAVYLVLMLLVAICAACTLVAVAQLDFAWATLLTGLALCTFEASLLIGQGAPR